MKTIKHEVKLEQSVKIILGVLATGVLLIDSWPTLKALVYD